MKSLFLPVITNGGHLVRARFATSLLAGFTGRQFTHTNIDYPYPNGAMNMAANAFMTTGCEKMFVIDGDIQFTRAHVDVLLDFDGPWINGLYRKKKMALEYAVEIFDGEPGPRIREDGLWDVKSAARGFSVWHRDVFTLMAPFCARYYCHHLKRECVEYFRLMPGGHSEDFEFCERWRSIGEKVLVDPRAAVRHFGDYGFEPEQGIERMRYEKEVA